MMMLLGNVKVAMIEACMQHICEKGLTPYIQVDTTHPKYEGMDTDNPTGVITLNLSGTAIRNYFLDEYAMSFWYAGGGKKGNAFVPIDSISMIYAKEDTTIWQPFAVIKVDTEAESVKVPTKPKRKGFQPRIV